MILTIFLNFVAMVTAYSFDNQQILYSWFLVKRLPLLFINVLHTHHLVKWLKPHVKLGQYSDFVKMSQFRCHGNVSFTKIPRDLFLLQNIFFCHNV